MYSLTSVTTSGTSGRPVLSAASLLELEDPHKIGTSTICDCCLQISGHGRKICMPFKLLPGQDLRPGGLYEHRYFCLPISLCVPGLEESLEHDALGQTAMAKIG